MTALKTTSLRLRNTDVKTLEDEGLDAEGVVTSKSKLRDKVKALSGVDILTNAGAYKSTYQILLEISQVWDQINSDLDKAALLELISGKRNSSVIAALLQNPEDLAAAYQSAQEAEGSAMRENEKYLDSIQGRVDQFNNAIQTMWHNTLDDDVIKWFVNLGTAAIKTADSIGAIPTALFGILAYKSIFKKEWDLASILGIHDKNEGWIIGQKGLTWDLANLRKNNATQSKPIDSSAVFESLDVEQLDMFSEEFQLNAKLNDKISQLKQAQNELKQLKKTKFSDIVIPESAIEYRTGNRRKAYLKEVLIPDKEAEIKAINQDIDDITNSMGNRIQNNVIELENGQLAFDFDSLAANAEQSVVNLNNTFANFGIEAQQSLKGKIIDFSDFETAAQQIDGFNAALGQGQTAFLNYLPTLNNADASLQAYLTSLNGAPATLAGFQAYIKAHNAELEASGIAAKAAAVGHAALNAAISMGISLLISGAIRLITDWINAAENAAKAAREAVDEYANATQTLKNHYNTIQDIKEDYAELAKGVDALGNNVSLTTEEYDRYNEIANKIADMFPEMISGYTKEGNAIIATKGNVEALTDAYEKEAKAARDAVLASQNVVFGDFINKAKTKDAFWAWDDTIGYADYLKVIQAFIKQANGDKRAIFDAENEMGSQIFALGLKKLKTGLGYDENAVDWKYDIESLSALLSTVQTEAEAALSSVQSILNAYLGNDFDYAKLSEDTKNIVQSIRSNFNTEFYAQFDSAAQMEAWIKTNLIDPLKDADATEQFELALNIQTQFNNDEISVKEYEDKIQALIDMLLKLGFSDDVIKSVRLMFDVDENGVVESAKQEVAKGLLDAEGDARVGELTASDLEIINKHAEEWKNANGGIELSFDSLMAKIKEAKELDWTPDVETASKSVDSIQSVFDELSDAVKEYNENGYFSVDTVQKLLEMEPKYLKLLYDENGNLNLNKNTLYEVAKARLADLGVQAKQSILENALTTAKDDSIDAMKKLTDETYKGVSADELAIETKLRLIRATLKLRQEDEIAKNGKSDITDTFIDNYISGIRKELSVVDKVISSANTNMANSISSSGNSAKETASDAFDKAMKYWENRIAANRAKYDQIQNEIDLLEKQGKIAGEEYYKEQIKLENERLNLLNQQKAEAKKYLNQFSVGSDEWWEAASQLNNIEGDIDDVTASIQDLNDAMDEIHWTIFDEAHERLSDLTGQLSAIRDLLSIDENSLFDDNGDWTEKGVTALATYIQEIEYYESALQNVNDELNKLKLTDFDSEQEYYDRVSQLKKQQQDYAKSIADSKKSVVDMYEKQIDAIEEYTNKAIDAYKELIDLKKKELDAEKDLYEFKKQTEEKTKNIAELERKIAALSGSTSASDIAERRKLEAELRKSQTELNDAYYDHAKSAQQDSLDEEQDAYEKSQNNYIKKLRDTLEEAQKNMSSFLDGVSASVMLNASTIEKQYKATGLSLDAALVTTWEKAKSKVSEYETDALSLMSKWTTEEGFFGKFKSEATTQLESPWIKGGEALTTFKDNVSKSMTNIVTTIKTNVTNATTELKKISDAYASINDTKIKTPSVSQSGNGTTEKTSYNQPPEHVKMLQRYLNSYFNAGLTVDGKYGAATIAAVKTLQKKIGITEDGKYAATTVTALKEYWDKEIKKIRSIPGGSSMLGQAVEPYTKAKNAIPPAMHAKGTTGTKKDEWAITDEPQWGDELTLVPGKDGNLSFMRKGTGVVPAKLTERLMNIAMQNPADMSGAILKPVISNVETNNNLNQLSFDSLVHIDNCSEDSIDTVKKIVNDSLDKFARQLNYKLKHV